MQVKGQLLTNYLWIWFEIQLPYIKNPDYLYKKVNERLWCHILMSCCKLWRNVNPKGTHSIILNSDGGRWCHNGFSNQSQTSYSLSSTTRTRVGMLHSVYKMMLSFQCIRYTPLLRPPSPVPWRIRITLERLSWRFTCPSQSSIWRFTTPKETLGWIYMYVYVERVKDHKNTTRNDKAVN